MGIPRAPTAMLSRAAQLVMHRPLIPFLNEPWTLDSKSRWPAILVCDFTLSEFFESNKALSSKFFCMASSLTFLFSGMILKNLCRNKSGDIRVVHVHPMATEDFPKDITDYHLHPVHIVQHGYHRYAIFLLPIRARQRRLDKLNHTQ